MEIFAYLSNLFPHQQNCNGYLMDTIINFRDHLEEPILDRAWKESESNDLMLCLGTTMTVTPANEMVEMGEEPLKLVICNRSVHNYVLTVVLF